MEVGRGRRRLQLRFYIMPAAFLPGKMSAFFFFFSSSLSRSPLYDCVPGPEDLVSSFLSLSSLLPCSDKGPNLPLNDGESPDEIRSPRRNVKCFVSKPVHADKNRN